VTRARDRKKKNTKKQLESEMLTEKPWLMRGEASGSARPFNSLLEAAQDSEEISGVSERPDPEANRTVLLLAKEKVLLTDYYICVLERLKICSLTEDRVKGHQRDFEVGSLGIECRHCGKDFFPALIRDFTMSSIACNVMLQCAKTALKKSCKGGKTPNIHTVTR